MALTQIVNDGLGASLTATSEGGAVTTSIQQGLAKSWCHIDGEGTPVISGSGSFNVSSLGDLGTGLVSASFTNNMDDDDFSHSFTTRDESFIALLQEFHTSTIRSTSRCVALCHDNATTAHADCDARSYTVHGDLA